MEVEDLIKELEAVKKTCSGLENSDALALLNIKALKDLTIELRGLRFK